MTGTAEEAREIQKLFPRATVLTGIRATKSALRAAQSPSILHIASHGFFLVNEDGRLVAISNRCTHKNAAIDAKGDGFVCPKHKSEFSIHGTVTKGQAKRTLPRYAITVKDGKVTVDPSKSFSEKQFEEKDAFVEVK